MNEIVIAIIASGGLWVVVLEIVRRIFKKHDSRSTEKQALGALLRHDMYQIYDAWRDAPEVPKDVQEEMDALYQPYHALGYNNTGTKIYTEIMRKPTKV